MQFVASSAPIFDAVFHVPFGALGVRLSNQGIGQLVYLPGEVEALPARSALTKKLERQLKRYLKDPGAPFDLPLDETGSPFQQRVWAAIAAIPSGEVRTYGQVARQIGSAPRAVGQACGANWFPLIIPCHRVIAAGGIGGFGGTVPGTGSEGDGFHLRVKRWLLSHEGAKDERLLA
jgi:methylated-DNA-[protein]-cysteine S-methyltransferase